jgi:small GTP-binding protein
MLTDAQARFLREEKETLAEVRLSLAELDVPREALTTLQEAILQLDELFLLVIVGEFNAGKSALVNALLGERVLPEGATPTTSRVTLVKWGDQAGEQVMDAGYSIYTYPLPLLKELNIVDTPGTNAIIREHERLTDDFVPRSDLVLFVTSADHPMTESERQFLQRILTWGKKVAFVLNKVDIIEDEKALGEVLSFVLKHSTAVLGTAPEFFPVSSRLAQRAQSEPDPAKSAALRSASRIDSLERFISATLDDGTRLQLKLDNPLGVAENLLSQAAESVAGQAEQIKDDRQTAEALENAVRDYERDLESELRPRLAEVEVILNRLEQRGLDFFDNTLRLTNIHNLVRGDHVRAEFEKQVMGDAPKRIDEQVQRLIDWLVQKDLTEWQRVMSFVQQRRTLNVGHFVGEGIEPREMRRRELIDSMGKTVQRIIESYDRDREASQLAAQVESAVAQTALLEVSAVGLGALVTTLVLSSSLDLTGILAAGTMAVVGFFVIPRKRTQAKENFKKKMTELRARMVDALSTQFNTEAQSAISRLKEGVTPYVRYVRGERERIEHSEAIVSDIRHKLSVLRGHSQGVLTQPPDPRS